MQINKEVTEKLNRFLHAEYSKRTQELNRLMSFVVNRLGEGSEIHHSLRLTHSVYSSNHRTGGSLEQWQEMDYPSERYLEAFSQQAVAELITEQMRACIDDKHTSIDMPGHLVVLHSNVWYQETKNNVVRVTAFNDAMFAAKDQMGWLVTDIISVDFKKTIDTVDIAERLCDLVVLEDGERVEVRLS